MSKKDINQEIDDGFKKTINSIEKDISNMDELIEKYRGRDEKFIYVYLKRLLQYHSISVVNEQGIYHGVISHGKRIDTLLNGILNMRNLLANIINEGKQSDKILSSLKQELDSIKTEQEELTEMKKSWYEALERRKKWLNENK